MSQAVSSSLLIVISAPSGAGKTTLCDQLRVARPAVTRAITATTRPPRAGERDGVDYHFLGVDEFTRRLTAGEFLESAVVYGHRYGVLRAEVLERLQAGRDVLLNIDVQGAATVRAAAERDPRLRAALVMVFLVPASPAELERRLRQRATDSEEVIQRRLALARHEAAQWAQFDYLLVSASVEEDRRRMLVIYEAEKLRQLRSRLPEGF